MAEKGAGLSVFWIQSESQQVQRLTAVPGGTEVHKGHLLQMAYTNERYTYGAVVGVDASYDVQWYHPSQKKAHAGGVRLKLARDEPFGGAWTIVAKPGPLRLYALFSDTPLDPKAVERAVRKLEHAGASVREAAGRKPPPRTGRRGWNRTGWHIILEYDI